jgi:Tfp pilus assembly protein PilF
VRAGAAARAPAEFAAALQQLAEAEARIDELPPERRELARFWTGVRTAEVLFHSGATERALATALAARDRARCVPPGGRSPYAGYYRVLLLALLWQAMPEEEFLALLVADEAEFLVAPETLADVERREPQLFVPLGLLRCELLFHQGKEFEGVRTLHELADALEERPKTPRPWSAKVFAALAWTYYARLDVDRAEIWVGKMDPADARFLRTLIPYRRGDYDTAEREARVLAAEQPEHRDVLGEVLEAQGKWEEALAEHERALAATDAAQVVDRAVRLDNVGDCQLELGDLPAAERSYTEALRLLDRSESPYAKRERGQMLMDLGRLAELEGERAAAAARYAEALAATEEARDTLPIDPLGASWLSGSWFRASIDGVVRLREPTAAGVFAALAATERGKARGLLDWIARPPSAAGGDDLRDAVRRLALTDDPRELAAHRLALDRARTSAAEAHSGRTATASGRELAQQMEREPDTLFLSYWVGATTAWLFAGGAGLPLQCIELGTRDAALAKLRAAYCAVADPRPAHWPPLDAAADFFVPHAVRGALQRAARVVFCPDADLHQLPFEVLRVGGVPIGAGAAVERAPSLSVRAAPAARAPASGAVVVVDRVAVPADAAQALGVAIAADLGDEGDRVAACYAGAVRLQGEDASLDRLAAALARAPVALLHVNAHALASPLVPSRSLLLLAGGPVSMASLAGLPLRGAVVVLSACSSAAGEARGGEGVPGLLWGPFAAGARAVVASLWPVNQEATAELMAAFHERRAAGAGAAAALRDARARLAASARYAHPHYWAGFAAYGSDAGAPAAQAPDPRAPATPRWLFWFAVATMALIVLWWIVRIRDRRR